MRILTNPVRLPIDHVIITSLAAITVVLGCGVTPTGQGSTRTFNVTGFTTLPVAMVYTEMPEVFAQVAGISTSKRQAQTFVEQLVMETVIIVLESQGRSALLPEEVISAILRQLTVNVIYEPLPCQKVFLSLTGRNRMIDDKLKENCIIAGGNTVTGICRKKGRMMRCMPTMMTIAAIPPQHLSISGTISTTNIIMANWSRQMWQNVVNRAVRMLTSGSFKSHFFSAIATVS
ncbi:hypothetical protein KIN20_026488 [Parelaphostrongylus tenuis]|uniref:Uncharacterized protein n=1 Tax=Parelaphostrongylus tenuis TaxID=148309 RepID=A0AAD5QY86_PARTN|nr:hypothetical protein KIN20_026488 [Parelaphostrongylus tenuis]